MACTWVMSRLDYEAKDRWSLEGHQRYCCLQQARARPRRRATPGLVLPSAGPCLTPPCRPASRTPHADVADVLSRITSSRWPTSDVGVRRAACAVLLLRLQVNAILFDACVEQPCGVTTGEAGVQPTWRSSGPWWMSPSRSSSLRMLFCGRKIRNQDMDQKSGNQGEEGR